MVEETQRITKKTENKCDDILKQHNERIEEVNEKIQEAKDILGNYEAGERAGDEERQHRAR